MSDHMEEAQGLLDSRESVYGERVKNMEDVAAVWSGILGTKVRADQVTLLMIGYKLVRASGTPDYEDNIKDVEGYALMFREIIGDDMISAFTTDEYVKIKNAVTQTEMAEACANCRDTICDGNCEEERIEFEKEVQRQWRDFNAEDRVPGENDAFNPVLAQQIKDAFDGSNAFVGGHTKAAKVAAQVCHRFEQHRILELQALTRRLTTDLDRERSKNVKLKEQE